MATVTKVLGVSDGSSTGLAAWMRKDSGRGSKVGILFSLPRYLMAMETALSTACLSTKLYS